MNSIDEVDTDAHPCEKFCIEIHKPQDERRRMVRPKAIFSKKPVYIASWEIPKTKCCRFKKDHLKIVHQLSLNLSAFKVEIQNRIVSMALTRYIILRRIKFLLKLDVRISGNSDKEVKSFMLKLKFIPSLSSISLDFSCNREITNHSINSISSGLKRLAGLSSVSLISIYSTLNNGDIENLSVGLKHLVSLSSLNLNFSRAPHNACRDIEEIFFKIRHHNFLSKISFDTSSCRDIGDKEVLSISNGLNYLKKITSLRLSFNCCYTPISVDQVFFNLFSNLRNFCFLTTLILDLSSSEISDATITELSTSIGHLHSISTFGLKLSCCLEITSVSIKNLGLALNELTLLSKLTLELISCREINDEDLHHLLLCLNHQNVLYMIDLNFYYCNKITDKGFKDITGSFQYLVHLVELKLNFSGCSQISEQSFSNMSSNLRHLVSLVSLDLLFVGCSYKKNDVDTMAKKLRSNSNLTFNSDSIMRRVV